MDTVNVLDPKTGLTHAIPYDKLPHALQSGGQFADEEQKKKAISLQGGRKQPSEQEEPEQERTGVSGLLSDIGHGVGNAYKSVVQFGSELPSNLKKSDRYAEQHPGTALIHNAGQLAAQLGSIGKGILNAPHDVIAELGRKQLAPQWLKKYNELPFTHIPEDTGIEKALGLQEDPEKGDALVRALPNIVGIASGAKNILKSTVKPNKDILFKRALEDQATQLGKQFDLTKEQTNQFKDSMKLAFANMKGTDLGELSPIGQKVSAINKENKLMELKPLTDIPEKQVGEIPEAPDTKAIVEAHKEATKTAKKDLLNDTLGVKDNPHIKAGKTIQTGINNLHDATDQLYKDARNLYKEKGVQVNNNAQIKDAAKQLEDLKNADELAPGYGSASTEQVQLENRIKALQNETLDATDVFDLQRTLEKMAKDVRKKQHSGVSQLEFESLGKRAADLDKHANTLAKQLESVGGKEAQSLMKQANKDWATYKEVSTRNQTGTRAYHKGDISSETITNIARSERGNEWLQSLVEKNPELRQQILAAHVGQNVENLLNPHTIASTYITHKDLGHVESKLKAFENALVKEKQGIRQAEKDKQAHTQLAKSMRDEAKLQKKRADAHKESEQLTKEIKFHRDADQKLDERIKIEEEAGRSTEALEKQKRDHQRQMEDKNGKLKKLRSFILKAKGMQSILNTMGL